MARSPAPTLAQLAESGALELRRQAHDLCALHELAALWRGLPSKEIVEQLVEVLLDRMRLDVVHVQFCSGGESFSSHFPLDLDTAGIGAASVKGQGVFVLPRPNVMNRSTIRLARFVAAWEEGTFVVGSWRENFPTPHEQRILEIAGQQAALAIQAGREKLVRQQLDAQHRALEQAHDVLRTLHSISAGLSKAQTRAEVAEVVLRACLSPEPRSVAALCFEPEGEPGSAEGYLYAREGGLRVLRHSSTECSGLRGKLTAVFEIALEGRVLGRLQLDPADPRSRSEEGSAFYQAVTQLTAQALDRARLFEATRIAEQRKDEFLAVLGHELRNPLAPIGVAAELIRRKAGAELSEEATIISREVAHLRRLVDDLLDVSRITRGKITLNRRELQLATIIGHAVEMTAPLFQERGHRLELHNRAEPDVVYGDPDRLAQVVTNLLVNAAKYTRPGGRITLTTSVEREEVVLRVRDTGIGMAPEMVPRLFQLFAQESRSLERSAGGLGLGLAIVRTLVDLHGGTVSASSPGLGLGSQFTVRLKAVATTATRVLAESPAPAPKSGHGRRVLVVDDNQRAARTLSLLLNLEGYSTHVSLDGDSALDAVASFRPRVALIDIGLPGKNGFEVATALRQRDELKPLLLVALTGYGQESDRQRALSAGFDVHLVKPVNTERLFELLAQAA